MAFCITHKVKLTNPALKAAHMTPNCLVYDPPGVDNYDASPVQMIDPIQTETVGTASYEEMVYPAPSGAINTPKKKAGEEI